MDRHKWILTSPVCSSYHFLIRKFGTLKRDPKALIRTILFLFVFITFLLLLVIFYSPMNNMTNNVMDNMNVRDNMNVMGRLTMNYGDYESKLCTDKPKPTFQMKECPHRAIVTANQLGRLGNQMWEYASVWAVGKETDREPFVPSCLISELEQVFDNLAIPTLAHISHCHVSRSLMNLPSEDYMNKDREYIRDRTDVDLLLPGFAQLAFYVVPYRSEIVQMFQFKKNVTEGSHAFLRNHLKYGVDTVFVSVHVRRRDYLYYLKALFNKSVVEPEYFLNIMKYVEIKYGKVMFVVLSDDPDWCSEHLLRGRNNVVVVRNSPPSIDLAIMAACNHSILDYGTFGMWGAMMAGGETFLYNMTWGLEYKMSKLMPNWHLVDGMGLV